jgi:ribonuclease HII
MRALSARYPHYLWENNVGYSTANHLRGIAAHGITPHHRRSFLPCRQLTLDFNGDSAEAVRDADQLAQLIDAATQDLT